MGILGAIGGLVGAKHSAGNSRLNPEINRPNASPLRYVADRPTIIKLHPIDRTVILKH
jgi:hypothetical protein